MDDVFEAVDGGNFSFAAFVGAAHYDDFVVFADGDGADLAGRTGYQRLVRREKADGTSALRTERRTLCFSRSSLFKGALIITRRTEDGALK